MPFAKQLLATASVILSLSATPLLAASEPASTMPTAKKQAVDHLNFMLFRIKMFYHDARSSMKSSLDLPLFRQYFSLPESAHNHYDTLGSIQLSEQQHQIRQQMEEWILKLHKRFPIGETCLIDRDGQEHLRVVGGRIEKPVHFSNEEHGSPFFEPSFQVDKGDVYVSEPYMSADSFRWVIAFTSPIDLGDGQRPAFYHFEVPLSIHQRIISTRDFAFNTNEGLIPDKDEEGRFFIIDRNSQLLIADSRQEIDYELRAERHPEKNPELPDFLPPEKPEDYLPAPSSISDAPEFLQAIATLSKGGEGLLELKIKQRPYVLVYAPIPGRNWSIAHLDPVKDNAFWEQEQR